MKNRTYLAGSILAILALGLGGCTEESRSEPKSDKPAIKPGPAYEPGPIQPSPIPQMPPTGPSAKPEVPEGKMDTPK